MDKFWENVERTWKDYSKTLYECNILYYILYKQYHDLDIEIDIRGRNLNTVSTYASELKSILKKEQFDVIHLYRMRVSKGKYGRILRISLLRVILRKGVDVQKKSRQQSSQNPWKETETPGLPEHAFPILPYPTLLFRYPYPSFSISAYGMKRSDALLIQYRVPLGDSRSPENTCPR